MDVYIYKIVFYTVHIYTYTVALQFIVFLQVVQYDMRNLCIEKLRFVKLYESFEEAFSSLEA